MIPQFFHEIASQGAGSRWRKLLPATSTHDTNMTARFWCFTYNNPVESADELAELFKANRWFRYLVFQLEIAPTTRTPHYQGYLEFNRGIRKSALIKIHAKIHYMQKYKDSDRMDARAYCMGPTDKNKEVQDGPWEYGEFEEGGQGHRSDLDVIVADIKAGKSLADIRNDNMGTYIKYHAGIDKVVAQRKVSKPIPKVYWFWGLSGTGKTREAKRDAAGQDDVLQEGVDYCFTSPAPRIWEDYRADIPRVIIDEYHPKNIPHRTLKRYIDRNPVSVNVMYGTIPFVPQEIYITCSRPPSEIWSGNELVEITRRCTEIREFI